MMSEAKRLHPAAIIFNFIRSLREAIFLIIFGYITFSGDLFIYFILGGSALLLLLIATSILQWYRFTYRVEEEELRIEYGILVRKKRFISKNRIQSIDLTSGVLHRLLKLAKVKIETAGSGADAEASLQAVKLSEGEHLRSELKKGAKQETYEAKTEAEEIAQQDQPVFKITFKRLFIAGTTSGSIGVVFAAFAFFFSQFEQFIPDEVYDSTMNWVIGLGIALMIGLAIVVLLVLWLLGIAGTMIKYGNFTIVRNKNELFITRGLLEKKQLTIPLNRIQAVGVQESLIRQPLGFATVFAEVAGGSMDKGEDFSTVMFPIMKKEEVEGFLQELLPDYAEQEEATFRKLPKRALKIYLGYATWPLLLVGAAVLYFIPQFIWAVLILIAVFSFFGFLQYKDAGFRVKGKRLSIRYRTFGRVTVNIYHKRMQAFEKKQHKIQKLQRLASMKVSIISKFGAGKHYKLAQLEEEDVNRLGDWYSYRKENGGPGSSAEQKG